MTKEIIELILYPFSFKVFQSRATKGQREIAGKEVLSNLLLSIENRVGFATKKLTVEEPERAEDAENLERKMLRKNLEPTI